MDKEPECGESDPLSGAVCTCKEDHIGIHMDQSVDGVTITWNRRIAYEYTDHTPLPLDGYAELYQLSQDDLDDLAY